MPCELSKSCLSCGGDDNLQQCGTCKERLKDIGVCQALCQKCLDTTDELIMYDKKDDAGFICNPCVKYHQRKEQEEFFQTLEGPTSEKIIRTVSSKFPWALSIAQASPDELLDALQFCKRKLSGHRTVAALADNLANSNSHAALLIQNLGGNLAAGTSPNATLASRTLRTFVKNQCLSIKYKTLLLPPHGSIHKATRHFQEMLKVEDPLVVALAQERIFLCEWAESNFRPTISEKQRRKGDTPETPEFALRILRCIFKSLSSKIKNAASKDEDTDIMIKAWYADHITWATTWAAMDKPAASTMLPFSANGESRQQEQFPKGGGKRHKAKDGGKGSKTDVASAEPPTKTPRLDRGASFGQFSFDELLNTKTPGQDIVAKMFQLYPDKAKEFWKENCRNCLIAGKGLVKHTFYECQKLGNPCVMRCVKCRQGNHWASECTA